MEIKTKTVKPEELSKKLRKQSEMTERLFKRGVRKAIKENEKYGIDNRELWK